MVYGTYNYSYWGFKPTNITGGPHIVAFVGRNPPKASETTATAGLRRHCQC